VLASIPDGSCGSLSRGLRTGRITERVGYTAEDAAACWRKRSVMRRLKKRAPVRDCYFLEGRVREERGQAGEKETE
jgi:hypothetical protein